MNFSLSRSLGTFLLLFSVAFSADIKYQALIGINRTTVKLARDINVPYVTGILLGIRSSTELADRFQIGSELLFSQKGNKWPTQNLQDYAEVTNNLYYFEIPAFISYLFYSAKQLNAELYCGIGPSFLLAAEQNREEAEEDTRIDLKRMGYLKMSDSVLLLGIRSKFEALVGQPSVELRLTRGLSVPYLDSNEGSHYHHTYSMMIGYTYK